jgi:CBS domain-containing protein
MAIVGARIPFGNQPLSIAASFGVAARLADTVSPEALITLADQALGVAKESGRNRVVAFSTYGDGRLDDSHTHVPLDDVLARDVMAPAVYSPHQDDTVDRVADMFLQLRLNAAPVVDDDARLVGIISENDLLAAAASNRCLDMRIRECMNTQVVQYDEETPAKDVFRFLSRASVPRVVVVSEARPTGVISRATLLRWLRNWSNMHRQTDFVQSATPFPAGRAGILRAADSASDRLRALRSYLATHDTDFVPSAVAEATRLEDLAQDILAHCRGQDRL